MGKLTRIGAGKIQGQSEVLSELGRRQVAWLAQRLKDEKIDFIISSDLERAVDTTKAISAFHNCPVRYMKELRERAYGSFEGRSREEYREAMSACGDRPECFRPNGGESVEDLFARAEVILAYTRTIQRPATLLISAHSGLIRSIICKLIKKPIDQYWSIKQNNTCLNLFTVDQAGEASSALINCTAHLAELS